MKKMIRDSQIGLPYNSVQIVWPVTLPSANDIGLLSLGGTNESESVIICDDGVIVGHLSDLDCVTGRGLGREVFARSVDFLFRLPGLFSPRGCNA